MLFASSCSDCGCAFQERSCSGTISTSVDCLVGQRHAASSSGRDARVAFALCLSGGYCSIGAYTKACADNNKWMLCSTSW